VESVLLRRHGFGRVAQGRRFALLLFVVLGMEGMYRLAREIKGTAFSGLAAAIVYTTWHPLLHSYLTRGWVNFFGFELLPWVVLGFIKGRTSVPWRIIGGMALGWIVLAAGTYTAPYSAMTVAYLTIAMACASLRGDASALKKELRSSLLSGATIGFVGLGLSLVKLLPMFILMRDFPRTFTPLQTFETIQLLQGYWHVYGIVLVVALVGIAFGDLWSRVSLAGALFFFVCAMGHFADWAPSMILRKLPLLSGMREPDRFMTIFHFFTVLAAVRGLTGVEDALSRGAERVWSRFRGAKAKPIERVLLPLSLSALAAAIVIHYGRPELETIVAMVEIKPHTLFTFESPRAVVQDFKQTRGNRRDAQVFPIAGRGTLYCLVGIAIPESPNLRSDLPAEEFPEDPAVATVERVAWTPHSITMKVEAKADTLVIVNQNFNRHWKASVGTVVDKGGLLAVAVPAGSHTLVVRYRDWLSIWALLLSLGTFVLCARTLVRHAVPVLRSRYVQYQEWGVPFALLRGKPADVPEKEKPAPEKEKPAPEEETPAPEEETPAPEEEKPAVADKEEPTPKKEEPAPEEEKEREP
jgi:hypothetical protein